MHSTSHRFPPYGFPSNPPPCLPLARPLQPPHVRASSPARTNTSHGDRDHVGQRRLRAAGAQQHRDRVRVRAARPVNTNSCATAIIDKDGFARTPRPRAKALRAQGQDDRKDRTIAPPPGVRVDLNVAYAQVHRRTATPARPRSSRRTASRAHRARARTGGSLPPGVRMARQRRVRASQPAHTNPNSCAAALMEMDGFASTPRPRGKALPAQGQDDRATTRHARGPQRRVRASQPSHNKSRAAALMRMDAFARTPRPRKDRTITPPPACAWLSSSRTRKSTCAYKLPRGRRDQFQGHRAHAARAQGQNDRGTGWRAHGPQRRVRAARPEHTNSETAAVNTVKHITRTPHARKDGTIAPLPGLRIAATSRTRSSIRSHKLQRGGPVQREQPHAHVPLAQGKDDRVSCQRAHGRQHCVRATVTSCTNFRTATVITFKDIARTPRARKDGRIAPHAGVRMNTDIAYAHCEPPCPGHEHPLFYR